MSGFSTEYIYEWLFFSVFVAIMYPMASRFLKQSIKEKQRELRYAESMLTNTLNSNQRELAMLKLELDEKNDKYTLELASFTKKYKDQLQKNQEVSLNKFKYEEQNKYDRYIYHAKLAAIKSVFNDFRDAVSKNSGPNNLDSFLRALNKHKGKNG